VGFSCPSVRPSVLSVSAYYEATVLSISKKVVEPGRSLKKIESYTPGNGRVKTGKKRPCDEATHKRVTVGQPINQRESHGKEK
jgi:hypothetical protein